VNTKTMEFMHATPRMCFEVKKVVGVSSDGCYQVQWAPSWVSKFHLVGCEHLIQEYLDRQKNDTKKLVYDIEPTGSPHMEDERRLRTHEYELIPTHKNNTNLDVATESEGRGEVVGEHDFNVPSNDALEVPSSMVYVVTDNNNNDEYNDTSYANNNQNNTQNDSDEQPETLIVKVKDGVERKFLSFASSRNDAQPSTSALLAESPVSMARELPSHSTVDMNTTVQQPFKEPGVNYNNSDHVQSIYNRILKTRDGKSQFLHLRREENKPYECTECGKRFSVKNNLKRHSRTHTGEKPFICEHCGKSFSDATNLKRHLLLHTGEKSFACQLCPQTFARKYSLMTHMKSHKILENVESGQVLPSHQD